jgi:hypothetical protein
MIIESEIMLKLQVEAMTDLLIKLKLQLPYQNQMEFTPNNVPRIYKNIQAAIEILDAAKNELENKHRND